MKLASLKAALLAVSIIGSTGAVAFADTPNASNNATVANNTGVYDSFDRFKDASGRPLPGWQYLIFPATGNG